MVPVADLSWEGATTPYVDVYRDGVLLVTTVNNTYRDESVSKRHTYAYKVCEEGTQVCSNEVLVTF